MDDHYVLVVHGTGNPPTSPPRSPEWHQLDNSNEKNFCRMLNRLFAGQYGMGEPVWRSVGDLPKEFDWGGANSHKARIDGGEQLFKRLRELVENSPSARIHLIGHSHGCNVILQALQWYLFNLAIQADTLVGNASNALSDNVKSNHKDAPAEARKIAIAKMFSGREQEITNQYEAEFDVLLNLLKQAEEKALEEEKLPGYRKIRPYFANGGFIGREAVARKVDRTRFIQAWMASKNVNRIGRMVFQGPAFYRKYWLPRGWSLGLILSEVVNYGFLTVVLALWDALLIFMLYIFAMLMWAMLATAVELIHGIFAVVPTIPSPVWNPLQWRVEVQVGIGILFLFVLAVFIGDATYKPGWGRRNVRQLYFNDAMLADYGYKSTTHPFDTLVVSAGLLDEVALGFAAEPLVYGMLAPQLRAIVFGEASKSAVYDVSGLAPGKPHRIIVNRVRYLQRSAYSCFMSKVGKYCPSLERNLLERLLQLLSAPAFGLAVEEFSDAHWLSTSKLDMPEFFSTTDWDVQKELLRAAPITMPPPGDRLARYAFLWDEKELEARKETSALYHQVNDMLHQLKNRYSELPDLNVENLEARLSQTSLLLEERWKEI